MTREDVRQRLYWGVGAAALMLLTLVGTSQPLVAQAPAAQYAPADIQFGSRIFAAQCAVCHGPTGDMIAGVDLRIGPLRRATTDAELRALIAAGIPGTAMPAFKFDQADMTMIVAYLRNMRDFNARSVLVGNRDRGRALFEGTARCATCHRVNGKGPRLAPDLSDIGTQRSADALQQTLIDPNANILPVNRSVAAVTKLGKTVKGRRLNEDTYSVQLIDEQERLVSLLKSDLKDYKIVMDATMPAYRDKLSAQELSDVVAYLLSLKGVR